MFNKNKVIIIIVILVLVCVVGYALFSENINISGTASASGGLELEITNEGTQGDYYEDLDITTDGNTLSLNAKLLKPGANAAVMGKIKNVGSVDAKLESITTTPESNVNLCEELEIPCDNVMAYKDENTGILMYIVFIDSEGMPNQDNIILTSGDDESTNSIDYIAAVEWDKDWASPITESQSISYTATFNFIQNK